MLVNICATKRFERYDYETPLELKSHMLMMKRKGYTVWEYSVEDLYAEYEMNEAVHERIIVDDLSDLEFE